MQYVFNNFKILLYISLLALASCGFSGGSAPNLFGNMKVFVTASSYTGALGGISGADEKCMSDSSYPGEGTYRALLSDGSSRTTHSDWVLIAGVKYIRAASDDVIATATSDSIFSFPLSSSIVTSVATTPYWSGLKANWDGESSIVDNCQNWTSASASFFGNIGRAEDTASSSIFDSAVSGTCNATFKLVCIEQ